MNASVVAIKFQWTDRDREVFGKLMAETPKTMRRAVGYAFSILRRNAIKAMTGQGTTFIPAVRPWHPLTNRMTRKRKFGGALADPAHIRIFKDDENRVRMGWLPRMEGAAHSWQDAETHVMGNPERHRLHQILAILKEPKPHSLIPMVYQRPARDIMTTLAESTTDKMSGWIMGAYEKDISRQLKKGWATS